MGIHLANLRIGAALNVRLSGATVIQYNSTSERLDLNVRLRYNFSEGTDLWLVYNDGLDDNLRSQARALLVKYTRTFGLR